MPENLDLSIPYNFLIDTLKMIRPNLKNTADDEIKGYLKELEGDYWAFLDLNSISPLQKVGILSSEQVFNIVNLKKYIKTIPVNLWNIDSFKTDNVWIEARKQANGILVSIETKKPGNLS